MPPRASASCWASRSSAGGCAPRARRPAASTARSLTWPPSRRAPTAPAWWPPRAARPAWRATRRGRCRRRPWWTSTQSTRAPACPSPWACAQVGERRCRALRPACPSAAVLTAACRCCARTSAPVLFFLGQFIVNPPGAPKGYAQRYQHTVTPMHHAGCAGSSSMSM